MSLQDKNILLIISGGIAAYKSLELIRLFKKAGAHMQTILTQGGSQFVTPLSVGALSAAPVYTDLFSLKDETEMGHIRLAREADVIVVAPASASFIAKAAHGLGDDLASTVLLATDKPVMIVPAMNPVMWDNPATQENLKTLIQRGFTQIGPDSGDTACGELGLGRMSEPDYIFRSVQGFFDNAKPLAGKKALITSGPTYEPLDPVRFIGNRSSGKQGHAIAAALHAKGADVTLISGPVSLNDPAGVKTIHVETASEMLEACQNALPADIAICTAAVSDWAAVEISTQKIKKLTGEKAPDLQLRENPDILAKLSRPSPQRPSLVIGFAAETENLKAAAEEKRARKKCDWIVANNVAENVVFGSNNNHVLLIEDNDITEWQGAKTEIANKLAQKISAYFNEKNSSATKAKAKAV